MSQESWISIVITLIVGIPIAYGLALLANLHTPRLVQFLDRRKLLKTHKTKKQALAVFNRIKAFREGKRDRYPFYIILAGAAISLSTGGSTLILISVLQQEASLEFRVILFVLALISILIALLILTGIYETARQIERFDDYEAEFKNKWGDP
jgi:hypothetical protein